MIQNPLQAAQNITLAWDAGANTTDARYRVYYGNASGNYTAMVDAGRATSVTISNLTEGATVYFAAKAYNTLGVESGYSTEVRYSAPISNAPPATVPSTVGTFHYDFKYSDRISLLAGGWNFIAKTATGTSRNTEQTTGAVLSFDQIARPGVLRIPADVGDLWAGLNDSRNSLFRNLPTNWTSVRLKMSFAPTRDWQQASLVAYQDDDNYLQVTREFNSGNGGNAVSFVYEAGGLPDTVRFASVSATNLHLRLDRDAVTKAFSAYYSLSGTNWVALGSRTQALNNPRLGIVVGSSPGGFPNADLSWVEVMTPVAPVAPVLQVSPTNLAFSTVVGSNPGKQVIQITNTGSGLNWTALPDGTAPAWLTVSPATGNGNGTITVSAASATLPAGTYSKTFTVTAVGAVNSPQTVTVNLTVTNPLPVVTLTSPVSGAAYSATATVKLAATVIDKGHSITKVQFFDGATLLGESASAPYHLSLSNMITGSHSMVARAIYDSGDAVDSSTALITVSDSFPPWETSDVGTVAATGSASLAEGLYTVAGAGTISGMDDNFRFVYQPLTGDGQITARLNTLEYIGAKGRMGVMIRESLTSDSRYVFMGVSSVGQFRWQHRAKSRGLTFSTTSTNGLPPDVWARLVRTGDALDGYMSTDGTNWTLVNSLSSTMASNIYVGLAVASGSSYVLSTTTFTNVAVVP